MEEQYGLLNLLGGGGESPGGLLGFIRDPESMAYLAMIAKAVSPHSEINPAQMLAQAQRLKLEREERLREDARLKQAQSNWQSTFDQRERLAQMRMGGDDPEVFGINPVVGESGRLGQLGNRGTFREVQLPEGFTSTKGNTTRRTATEIITQDAAGNIIKREPLDLAGAASATAQGKAQGEARGDLPNVLMQGKQSIELIDSLINHPGRETGTGLSSKLDPRNYIPGTDSYNFHVRNKQMGGRVFLQAYESLRGGGHITEVEGQKGERAMARLETAQSDAEYLSALKELRGVISRGMEVARTKAGMSGSRKIPAGIPEGAIKALRSNPRVFSAEFDRKYGAGSAAQILGE